MSVRAGLVGVTGYTGMELVRILAGHPHIRLSAATSRAEAGKRLGDIYPFLNKLPGAAVRLTEPDPRILAEACDIVFLAAPHGAAMEMAAAMLDLGKKVIDLSADFRLRDPALYDQWYEGHSRPDLLPRAVYGLPELYGEAIARADLVANPGCYPTASVLGLAAPLTAKLIETEGIVIDAKSGTSGAGRTPGVGTLFCEVQDTFRAYNLARHRHTPEIEQEASALAGTPVTLHFAPHLVPMNRGILATIYTRLKAPLDQGEAQALFENHWQDAPFVRVLPSGRLPETRHVRGSMFCDLAVLADPRTRRLIVVSVIDNLCRGASGQAVANANLMCGLPLAAGLEAAPLMP
ncbi:MAG: N-acetyl-gamma-glutamyl-phosphate reductase [Deltaproteobacteria bacterium]|jgi:N-acetyl-gamma-glutamyl-phosphate reductase|nr:N-acetyl-gamma-glutamyl-phosphate reductase [Deltaproteobacteria bacterium]